MQRVSGENLKYAELCVCYGKEKYLLNVEQICLESRERFAYDVLQRFYRLKVKFSAQTDIFEDVEISDTCRKSLADIEKYFDAAKNACERYSTDSNYLAENLIGLAFETDYAINSEIIYTADEEFSVELNHLYGKIIQALDEATQHLLLAQKFSDDEKISLLEKLRDFYSADDYTAMYRSENFFDPNKQDFYQSKIDELRNGANVTYFYPSDVRFQDLALACESQGNWDESLEFYKKAYETGEPTYDLILYSAAKVCLTAGYTKRAIENLQEILRIDRENPNAPFTNHACLKLIDIWIAEKNFDAAKKLIAELIKKNCDENSTYAITYLTAANFRLYLLENNIKFWDRAVEYFKLLEGEEHISDALHDFVSEYVLRTDDLAEIENLTRRLDSYHEESVRKIFEHAIKISANNAAYHVKFLTDYSLYLSGNLYKPSAEAMNYCEQAEKYLAENFSQDAYLKNLVYRAKLEIAFKSDDVDYLELKKIKAKCDYFLLTEREVETLDDDEKFQRWRNAAQDYDLAENFHGKLRCLEQAEKISVSFTDYRALEIDKIYCFVNLGEIETAKNLAKKLYDKLIKKYFSANMQQESISLTDSINDLVGVFEKISCTEEVFVLSIYEICTFDLQADKKFMASLQIKPSAEPKILGILDSLTKKNLDDSQIDFIIERIEKISQLNLENDFAKKILSVLNQFVKKFQYGNVEFKINFR